MIDSQADRVFLAGPEMRALADALPAELKVEYRASASELEPLILGALRPGDAVMVKSSKGIGFSKLVESVLRKFPAAGATGSNQ